MSNFTTLTDNSFEEKKTVQEGNQSKLMVVDVNLVEVFQDVLKELKIMNLHLSNITDMCITEKEVE